jgi:hypothetical protein
MVPNEDYRDDVRLKHLRLDPDNPRLPGDGDWAYKSEYQLLTEFFRRYNLIELARSIADKGFTPRHAEALLVVEDSSHSGYYIVVEGNRRLATLKLLTSEENRREVGATSSDWEDLAKKASQLDLGSVPVVVYHDRESLNDYLGFRHITGPTPWRPEAKARFISKLLRSEQSIGDVARRIGSNHRTVRRYAEAHAVYTQAADTGIAMDKVEAKFGIFYNALDQQGVRTFLTLGPQAEINTLPESPIPSSSMDRLGELIDLLYGDADENVVAVIRESRDLAKLGQVLGNDRARANLMQDRNLERAWRVSGGGRAEVIGLLLSAHSRLAEVNGQAAEYGQDAEVRREVRRICSLVADMATRYEVNNS